MGQKCQRLTHIGLIQLTHSLTHSFTLTPNALFEINQLFMLPIFSINSSIVFYLDLSATSSLDAIYRRIRTTTFVLCFFVRFLPFLLPREDIVRGFLYYTVLYPYHCHYLVLF